MRDFKTVFHKIFFVIIGLFLALTLTVLAIFEFFPNIATIFLPLALFGLVFIGIIFISGYHKSRDRCICDYQKFTLVSSFGIIIFALISLASTFLSLLFIVSMFLSFTAFFVSIFGLFAMIVCIPRCNDDDCNS